VWSNKAEVTGGGGITLTTDPLQVPDFPTEQISLFVTLFITSTIMSANHPTTIVVHSTILPGVNVPKIETKSLLCG